MPCKVVKHTLLTLSFSLFVVVFLFSVSGDLDLQLTVTVNNGGGSSPTGQPQKASDGTESKAMYGNALNQNANSHLTTTEEKPM